MHDNAYAWCKLMADAIPPPKRVLDIGSRDINGNCRALFPGAEYIGLDLKSDLPGVDVIADGVYWEGDGAPFDVVVCTETLEHASNGEGICANAYRLLRVGGHFIVTAAGEGRAMHSGIDGGPLREGEFYRNVTKKLMTKWLDIFQFKIVTTHVPTDTYAIAVKL